MRGRIKPHHCRKDDDDNEEEPENSRQSDAPLVVAQDNGGVLAPKRDAVRDCVFDVHFARAAGNVNLPSGRIVVGDPARSGHDALVRRVPPGRYPATISVAWIHQLMEHRVAAAMLRFRAGPVATWEPAPGFRFVAWQGLDSAGETATLLPLGDTAFTAVFAQQDISIIPPHHHSGHHPVGSPLALVWLRGRDGAARYTPQRRGRGDPKPPQ